MKTLTFFKTLFSTTEKPVVIPIQEPAVKFVIIDGKNVMYGSPTDQNASLLNVLGLVDELNNRGIAFKAFFDANTFYTLMKAGKKDDAFAYRRICHDYPDFFIEVPGHNRADDFLLDYADKGTASVISNDRFRDFALKYGWLTSNPSRRASFLVHSGIMQIVGLGITASIPLKLADAESMLRDKIGRITGKFVPTVLPHQANKPANKVFNGGYNHATA